MMLNATLDKIRIWNAAVDKDTIANNYAYLPATVNPNYEHIVADFGVKGKHDGIVENLAGMAQDAFARSCIPRLRKFCDGGSPCAWQRTVLTVTACSWRCAITNLDGSTQIT